MDTASLLRNTIGNPNNFSLKQTRKKATRPAAEIELERDPTVEKAKHREIFATALNKYECTHLPGTLQSVRPNRASDI